MKLESMLQSTELYLEGIEQGMASDTIINSYYGFNVSRTDSEPIDQISAFIAAKRIQENNYAVHRNSGNFVAFIAGVFEVLNQPRDQVPHFMDINGKKDRKKSSLFRRICTEYDLNSEIVLTRDLWSTSSYWNEFQQMFEDNWFTHESLENDTKHFISKSKIDNSVRIKDLKEGGVILYLPDDLMDMIGEWPGALIYTPAEISEAAYFANTSAINLKLGPATERIYDRYIARFMDIAHLKQSVDLRSDMFYPQTVTPYSTKNPRQSEEPEARIFFDDSEDDVKQKINEFTPTTNYLWTMENTAGVILNPIVEKAIYSVESARALGLRVPLIGGNRLRDGHSVIDFARNPNNLSLLREALPELVYNFLIGPFKGGNYGR